MGKLYKKKIVIKVLIIIGAMAVILIPVLPVLGLSALLRSWLGLAVGAAASLVTFLILMYGADKMLTTGKRIVPVLAYVVRVIIYGAAVLFVTLKFGYAACLGAGLGLLSWAIAVIWHNAVPALVETRRKKAAKKQLICTEYIDYPYDARGNLRYLLIRSYSIDIWRGGKHYITHRKFKLLAGSGTAMREPEKKGDK